MAESDEHALLLQISYDLNRLQSQGRVATGEVDKHLTTMERSAKKTAQQLEETFSFQHVNFKFGFDKALLGATQRISEEGSRNLGAFGGALEALGPVGLGAGAAVAAGMFSIERAMKTAEWAEDLQRAAKTLGVTTTQLQEFDFVAQSTGIPVDRMRESLQGLASTIGRVQDNLVRGKNGAQVKVFELIFGESNPDKAKQDLRELGGNLDAILPKILDLSAKLAPTGRAGLAQALKMDPQVLEELTEARAHLADLITEAHKYGIVMSEDAVKRTAEAAEKMHVASAVIDGELKIAFADLAPLVAQAATWFADITKNIADFIRGVQDTLKPLDDMIGKLERMIGLKGAASGPLPKGAEAGGAGKDGPSVGSVALDALAGAIPGGQVLLPLLRQITARGAQARAADDAKPSQRPVDKTDPALEKLIEALGKPPAKGAHRAKAEHDDTESQTRTADDDQEAADKALADAKKALTTDITERAAFEVQAINDQAGKEQEKLAADRKKLLADKTIEGKQSDILQAKIEQAQAEAEQTRLLKVQLVQRQLDVQKAQQAEASRQIQATGEIDYLRAQQSLWQTAEQRRALALKVFDLEEQNRQAVLKAQIAQAQIAKNKEEEARLTAQLASQQATEGARREAVSQQNPGGAWNQWVQSAQNATQDVSNAFQQMQVNAIDKFNQSLFDSQGRLNSFGQIARNVARQFISDFEQFSVKSIEAGIFGGQGNGSNPLSNLASSFGGHFGLGGKGGKGGGAAANKPTGSAADPIYTKSVDAALGGAGGGLGTSSFDQILGGATGNESLSSLFGGGGLGSSSFDQILGGASGNESLASLFGGGGGASDGGGILSLLMKLFGGGSGSGLGSLFGFDKGGEFEVGGAGGVDKNLAMMRVSRGEKVSIATAAQQREAQTGGVTIHQNFNFPGANPDSFMRTQRQWSRQAHGGMALAGA